MAARTERTKTNKQEALNAEYKHDVKHTESKINQSIQKHAARIKKMHQQHVQDLRDLIARRMQIEKDILKDTTELQEAYDRSREIFEVVLNGRMEDCEKNLTQLKTITEENCEYTAEESQEL